jgi:hypothetical protein
MSLLLVGIGYVLLVAGPLLSPRLSALLAVGSASSAGTLPTAASAGIALLGAAAMVLVLAQLVRDVESNPYAAIAPVLAVFSAYLLTSARAKLPFAGFASEHLGLFVLTLALLGGALIGRQAWGSRLFGWSLALLPFIGFLLALQNTSTGPTLVMSDGPVQTYLLLLGVSAVSLAFAGSLSRNLLRSVGPQAGTGPSAEMEPPSLRMPRPPSALTSSADHRVAAPPMQRATLRSHADPRASASGYAGAHPHHPNVRAPGYAVGGAGQRARAISGEQMRMQHAPSAHAPAYDGFDDEAAIALMRGKRGGGKLLMLGVAVLALAAAGYFLYAASSRYSLSMFGITGTSQAPVMQATQLRVSPIKSEPVEVKNDIARSVVTPLAPAAAEPSAPAVEPKVALPDTSAQARLEPSEAQPSRSVERKLARADKRRRSAQAKVAAEPPKVAAPKAAKVEAQEQAPAAARAKRETVGSEPRASTRASEPASKSAAAAKVEKPEVVKPEAAPAPTQNERDLDLDQLVHKALKNSNGVSASDDPLLGL